MRLLLPILFALASSLAQAAPVDSSASGIYRGTDRFCGVQLSRTIPTHIDTYIWCIEFDGDFTVSLSRTYAPNSYCPVVNSFPLAPWRTDTEHLSLRSFDPNTGALQIVRGTDSTAVVNGVGIAETWALVAPAPSPIPFTCGPAAPRIDPHALARFCREHPTVPACRG